MINRIHCTWLDDDEEISMEDFVRKAQGRDNVRAHIYQDQSIVLQIGIGMFISFKADPKDLVTHYRTEWYELAMNEALLWMKANMTKLDVTVNWFGITFALSEMKMDEKLIV